MGANGIVVRGEMFKLAYALESSFGVDPGTVSYTHPFGVVQSAVLPDPVFDHQTVWTLGTNSKRDWSIAYRGKILLEGNVPDIWLLDGRLLWLPLGAVADAGSPGAYTHTITESTGLPSIAMHATYAGSNTSTLLMRRFLGGKVNRMTIEATEGDYLKASIDNLVFSNWAHDQVGETGYSATVADVTIDYPSTQPYFFSMGSLSLNGTTFARIRNFRLEINNNMVPKFYIQSGGGSQLPYEYREGRREYRMTAQIDLEDASLYKELVRQGIYTSVYKGFQTVLTYTRAAGDTITMTMPSAAAATGLDAMGCLITRAPHNIMPDPVVSSQVEFVGRGLGIVVADSISSYQS